MFSISLASTTFKVGSSDQYLKNVYSLGLSPKIKPTSFKLIKWIPPITGLVLNVDGVSKGNPGLCGGGGCIRDSTGNLLLAFAHFYGYGSSLVAEVRSLCDGIRLAMDHGLPFTEVRSDSATLITSLSGNKSPAWDCLHWWREAHTFLHQSHINYSHTFRQANLLANALANYGCSNATNLSMQQFAFLKFEGQTFSCKGSVDTTINGVDTMAQSKGRNVKKRSTSVDTSLGQVDTRDRSQRNMLTGFHLRSTLNQINQLDHLKEADQVEADFCEEFKEDPESDCRASSKKLPEIKALHNSTFYKGVVCEPSSSVVCESSYSLCGLSSRAQFGVVVLRLLFEPSCSVWSRRAPGVS
ncbi:hypothetical protein Taro_054686 [Colocasia esculenta]|uniref:RNase H type-1 domain-containing protein n=1 Tax=Colocasia esculenta TaxID=4460 RepID=A0A843XR86_COLES|nr:hypothetical protein [Colocasia esculenta]